MENVSYIKLFRKLLNSPIFENEKALKIWIWCLLKATHTEREQLVGRQIVQLKKGQFIFGRKKASEELKMKERTLYDYLKLLEELSMIRINSNNKFSVITVEKWEEYQVEELKNNNEDTTNARQTHTNKNVKNIKNNISSSNDDELKKHFEKIWEIYPNKKGKLKSEELFFKWVKGRKINKSTIKLTDLQMYKAVKKYKEECEKKNTEQEYIKHGDTFFNKAILDYVEAENE